jgi:hypothetical protein
MLELDHVFVCSDAGAPEADRLVRFGLSEGRSWMHPGQGTANRCFFFHNAMLELLWVHDEAQARSEATRRTRLLERWLNRSEGSCPFGVCFRSSEASDVAPFAGWHYRPEYLQAPQSIYVANNSDLLHEPMLFYIPFGRRPDAAAEELRQPLDHSCGFREITRVHWSGPTVDSVSPELDAVLASGALSIGMAGRHALQIGFDREARGMRLTVEPLLPVSFRW